MVYVTGRDVTWIRNRLKLDAWEFACLLGVSVSTVYRWCAARRVSADPVHAQFMERLQARLNDEPESATQIASAAIRGIRAGGTLHALRNVLEILIVPEPPRLSHDAR